MSEKKPVKKEEKTKTDATAKVPAKAPAKTPTKAPLKPKENKKVAKPGAVGVKLPLAPKAKAVDPERVGNEAPFLAMEKADEDQIQNELTGRSMIDALVYRFQDKTSGRTITELSYEGVRETVRTMNTRRSARIFISSEVKPEITETEKYIQVMVYAKDEINGGGFWGIKRQDKKDWKGNSKIFPLEQAVSKAQRNALRGLIPAEYVKQMIAQYMKAGKVQTLGAITVNTGKQTKQYDHFKKPAQKTALPAPAQSHSQQKQTSGGKDYQITEKQLGLLFGKLSEIDVKGEDSKKFVRTKFPQVKSRKEITKSQLDAVLKDVEDIKSGKKELSYTDEGRKLEVIDAKSVSPEK